MSFSNNSNSSNNSRILGGVLIIAIGMLFFLRQAGITLFPFWFFSWPMILIAVGLFVGFKHGFRGPGWLILLIVGSFFLIDSILDVHSMRRYLVPAILVGIGVMLIVRPKKKDPNRQAMKDSWKSNFNEPKTWNSGSTPTSDTTTSDAAATNSFTNSGYTNEAEKLDAAAIFGGVKKNILSKNFIGGEAVSIFGGSEIDLSKADINGTVKIDITAILGGVKLIVPPHWTIRQEVAAIFGGVDDKREINTLSNDPNKILVLKGTAFMGGIEISCYR
jgi:predicted membrane protein